MVGRREYHVWVRMKKSYKFRLYPKKEQTEKLDLNIWLCRHLFNSALEQRKNAWEMDKENISYNQQAGELHEIKKRHPEYGGVHSQVLQDILRRVDKSFKNFYRRVKEKREGRKIKAGYPRFKSARSFKSISHPQSGFRVLENGHLKISKIGTVRMFKHRDIEGHIKTMTLKKDAVGDWFAIFTVDVPDVPGSTPKTAITVDVGLETLTMISTGEMIEPPRFLRKSEEKLKISQRRASRKKKGSNNRKKTVKKVAKAHRKIQRQRDDFLHRSSRKLVERADIVVFEGLNIRNMVRNHCLAKSIMDASWGKLMRYTAYKAESAGKQVTFVDPWGTSQECSNCGKVVRKSLSDRIHMCPHCGFCIDRDLNSTFCMFKRLDTGGVELLKKMPPEFVPLLSPQGDGKHG